MESVTLPGSYKMEKSAATPVSHHLQRSYEQLSQVCDSINAFTPSDHVYQPPIIDNHETRYAAKEISGLAKFRGICEKESDWLEEVRNRWYIFLAHCTDDVSHSLRMHRNLPKTCPRMHRTSYPSGMKFLRVHGRSSVLVRRFGPLEEIASR